MKYPGKKSPVSRRKRKFDLVAVGELLADFISDEVCTDLAGAGTFRRYRGGSAANLTANMALVGNRTVLIACVGKEALGDYLVWEVGQKGVATDYIVRDPENPTTLVILTRTPGTADFIAYRMADACLFPGNISNNVLKQSSVYHTTCFALSREPSRSSIIDGARRAVNLGCQLSIDVNYAPAIWPDREEAKQVLAAYCSQGAFLKISLDDVARLSGEHKMSNEDAVAYFHNLGAGLVCLTLGEKGSLVSWNAGNSQERLPGAEIEVADATGAGDAYWAGFLTAWLDGYGPPACALAGSKLAAIKLQKVGPLASGISKEELYARDGAV